MRESLRASGLWLSTAFRVSPALTVMSMLLMLVQTVANPLEAYGVKLIVDGLGGSVPHGLLLGAALVVGAFAGSYVASTIGNAVSGVLDDRLDGRIHADVLALTTGIPGIAHHELPGVADRLELVKKHARELVAGSWQLVYAFATMVGTATVLVFLAGVHPLLLGLPLLGSARVWASAVSGRLRQQAIDRTASHTRRVERLMEIAAEPRHGTEVRVFGLAVMILRRMAGFHDVANAEQAKAVRRGVGLEAVVRIGFGAVYVAAVLWVIGLARQGRAGAGDVALVVLLAPRVDQAAGAIAHNVREIVELIRLFGRYAWLRDYAKAHAWTDSTGPAPTSLRAGIELRDVEFAYPGAEQPALRDVNLRLPAGATVGLVGENGAGKTTLVKLLTRLYDPTHGSVTVDGTDLATIAPDAWRRRTSAGFQDFVKYEFTAREAVGLGDLERIDDDLAVDAALRRGDARTVVDGLPAGLDTQLGARFGNGVELSGGQWQRLALARAFMRERPLLLILDEPTAALDPEAEHALFTRFAAASRAVSRETGGITVLVSHRFSTVRMADLIVVLEGGRILETGGHTELLARSGRYAELFRLQARAYR